jgi:hypothetical protein
MKTLTFSTAIHFLSFLEDLSVRPSIVGLGRLPPCPLHACQTWINFTSSPFLQVYQLPPRRSLSAYGLSLPAPFLRLTRLSGFALDHHFPPQDPVTRLLTATAKSHSFDARFTYRLARSVSTQRPLLHSPSASRSQASPSHLRYLLSSLSALALGRSPPPSSTQPPHTITAIPVLGNVDGESETRNYTISRYTRKHNVSYVPVLDDGDCMPGARAGTMPDLTRTGTRVLGLDTSSTLFFPIQSTSFFVHIALCYTIIKLFVAL